jgi:hypothetical protein
VVPGRAPAARTSEGRLVSRCTDGIAKILTPLEIKGSGTADLEGCRDREPSAFNRDERLKADGGRREERPSEIIEPG